MLSESVNLALHGHPDGHEEQSGVFWKLRDENGTLVVVHVGQLVFDADFNLVKFTPNSGPDFVEVICTAMGGHLARPVVSLERAHHRWNTDDRLGHCAPVDFD